VSAIIEGTKAKKTCHKIGKANKKVIFLKIGSEKLDKFC
jgi:hypothetical protein